MIVLSIDAGPTKLGWVEFDTTTGKVLAAGVDEVEQFIQDMPQRVGEVLVLEWLEFYGQLVGRSIYETAFVIGRLAQRWRDVKSKDVVRLKKPEISLILCGRRSGIKDKHTKAAIESRLGTPKGTKGHPDEAGLYMVKEHAWDALAAAIAFTDSGVPDHAIV